MKRIITCSDGTWNKPNSLFQGQRVRTNVQKIFDHIVGKDSKDIVQIKHYDDGVGSGGNLWDRLVSGATGKGIDENIVSAYKFILWNYEKGDELFLFGFSRGAYTARSLAGLIRKCGIVKSNNLDLIQEAYKLYRNKEISPDTKEAVEFREKNSYSVKIKFIGVWDTVGTLGIPLRWFQWYNKMKYQFHDTTLSSSVENAYHALAIDERRGNFEPARWNQSEKVKSGEVQQTLEQCWFVGVHSNIGGGYPNEGLSDIALEWMIGKAEGVGLCFDGNYHQDIRPDFGGTLFNSLTGIYQFLPKHLRQIAAEDFIHPSVYSRINGGHNYSPGNLDLKRKD